MAIFVSPVVGYAVTLTLIEVPDQMFVLYILVEVQVLQPHNFNM